MTIANKQPVLISMADIAKLANQSRSTVGNWKNRQADFPTERGSTPRGPMYDKDEVIDWLTKTGRIAKTQGVDRFVWRLMETLRGSLRTEDAIDLIIVTLAVKITAQRQMPAVWTEIVNASNDRMAKLENAVHELLPFVSELYGRQVQRAGGDCQRMITLLDSFDTTSDQGLALLNSLYENLTTNLGRTAAEHTSPSSVRRLLVRMAEPKGIVYNPGAGLGQLLAGLSSSALQEPQLVAQEENRRTWELGTLNMFLRGISVDYRYGDLFTEDAFPELLADRAIAIAPFNVYIPQMEHLQDDPRWVFGEPGPRDGNAAWIQHCLHHLAPYGRALLILSPGALFEGGRAGRIRQRIIKADLLDAVISLPGSLFPHTTIPTALLVFQRNRRNAGTPSIPGPVLMMDASDLGEKRDRLQTYLPEDAIALISNTYSSWQDGKSLNTNSHTATASFATIVGNDFVIDPRRYVTKSSSVVDKKELSAQKDELQKSLVEAIAACNVADGKLLKSFGRSV